ncbi:Alpha/beta hydrolase domain-containing protein [uncultured Mycobacterium sp.]|uniref:Alpha/beta hydrolase domain-containing protein n=1 Tax=uncultured Mycobacterium sp. TaxID=171292 RepID=A0A1Y5PGF4_9MYCO|nr:Alpha/beta hydrolase domain-containing protein [uncultured Mycobacterium sp.]
MAVGGRLAALRDAEVVPVSATASVRIHRLSGLSERPPALLWIHGGGYVTGSAAMNDRAVRKMAANLGALAASVEYRLAPEHPYPAALDDCYAALQWLAARDDIDRRRILIAGKSAGGGLAAALALRCLDAGLVELAGQVLIYPMLDDRTVQRSTAIGARGWTPQDNSFGWRSYLGRDPGEGHVSAYAAPARRADLSGLPPTWIGVGTADLFYDECVDYANRLRAAGVPTQLRIVPGGFHGFDVVGSRTSIVRQFRADQLAAMRQAFAPWGTTGLNGPAL